MRALWCLPLLVLPFPAVAQDQEEEDKGFLTNLIEENLSGDTRDVTITGFQGALSSEATIERLTVADSDGVWLILEDVVLDWNRSALLRGAIEVETLGAALISVERAPLPDTSLPPAEATPFSLPELPVSIYLGELSVDRIELGEVFLGAPVAVSVTGTAELSGGEGSVDVTAQRVDEATGEFLINGSYSNATQQLDLALTLDEDNGGIVARLLDLPGQPSVKLSVEGSDPITDFTATLALETEGEDRLAGTLGVTQTDTGRSFGIDVGGDITPLFAPEYQTFFGNDLALQADGQTLENGGFQLENLTLQSEKLTLEGEVAVADGWPTKVALTGDIGAANGDIVLLPISGPKTYVTRADLDVSFDASVSETWDINFEIAGFDRPGLLIDELSLTGDGVIDRDTSQVTADLSYAATGLQLDDSGAAEALGTRIEGETRITAGGDDPIRIEPLTLRGAGIDLQAEADITTGEDGVIVESAIVADVVGLERFATLAGIDLGGDANLSVISTVRPLEGSFSALLNGTTDNLEFGIEQVDNILAGEGNLSLQAVRDTNGTRVEALRIETGQGVVTADAELTSEGSRADLEAELTNAALLDPSLQGPITLDVTASQTGEGTLVADIAAKMAGTDLTADVTMVTGEDGRTFNLDAVASVDDLSRYAELAGRDIAGAADLNIAATLLGDATRVTLSANGTTNDLAVGVDQLDPLLAGPATLTLDVARTSETGFTADIIRFDGPNLQAEIEAAGDLQAALSGTADITLPRPSLVAPGLDGPLRLTADLDRADDQSMDLLANIAGTGVNARADVAISPPADGYVIDGTVTANADSLRPFSELAGRSLGGSLDLDVTGRVAPDLSVVDADIDVQTGGLSIGLPTADRLIGGQGSLVATVSKQGDVIDVPTFRLSTAQLSANGSLQADGPNGSADFTARLADVSLFTDQLSGPATVDGTASKQGDRWRVDVDGTGPGGISAQANGTVGPGGRLNMDANGVVPLGLANDLLAPRRINGNAQFDLSINGPPALSSVSGVISTNGARLALPTLTQALENISGQVRLSNGSAQVDLGGDVQTGGSVALSGTSSLSAPFPADLRVAVDSVVVRDPTLYETSVDGVITVQGNLTQNARISGTLNLGETNVQVPSSGLGSLGDLPEVTHVGETAAVRRTLNRADYAAISGTDDAASAGGPVYPLSLTINAPSRIFVRGRGLDAELGGTLRLGGTTQNIVPVGEFSLIRGRLDILQQRFELNEGIASLQGDFVPYIRLVAVTEASTGTQISIIVEGPATEPEVRFESVPDLPQDEVLAQLIFGRDISEISPLQAVQLASAVATLSGRGGAGLVDNFRSGAGLADFDITTDDDGNAAVRAGAYLSENVYTDVTVNAEGETEINLNLDITDEITAKGSVDADGETSIGIFFERDY